MRSVGASYACALETIVGGARHFLDWTSRTVHARVPLELVGSDRGGRCGVAFVSPFALLSRRVVLCARSANITHTRCASILWTVVFLFAATCVVSPEYLQFRIYEKKKDS